MSIKAGSKAKCIATHGSTSGIYVPLGTILTVTKVQNQQFQTKEHGGMWFFMREFESTVITTKELEEQILELESQIEDLKVKKLYLEETNQKEFDETEFKVFATLRTLKTEMSDLEKAKVIASLISAQ